MPSPENPKDRLRREMRHRLAGLSPTQIANDSEKLREQLSFPPHFRVALFADLPGEPMLLELIPRSPEVSWFLPKVTGPTTLSFLPVTHLGNLRPGSFGIPEPPEGPEAESLDVIVCPGLAFTPEGHRLGRGGGFYDRVLTRFPGTRTIGVAFSCQIQPLLPLGDHDMVMDSVFTPDGEPPDETPEC